MLMDNQGDSGKAEMKIRRPAIPDFPGVHDVQSYGIGHG
jgi:hypothetical protein